MGANPKARARALEKLVAPDIDPDNANYAHCQVIEYFPVEADKFFEWYLAQAAECFMLGTLIVPPITGTEEIEGFSYLEPEHPRIIWFKDGTYSLERVLTTNWPRSYFYQPYGYDNPVCVLSDHAKATMTALPDGANRTKIVWDYAFHAKNKFALQLLKLFVWLDWRRNMRNGLIVLKNHLSQYGYTKNLDEV